MRVIIGGTYYPTIDGSSVSITRSVSDPVPTATVNIVDVNSSLAPQEMQEILILDDQVIPNPTINLLLNPAMNPYNTNWGNTAVSGLTFSQNPGGGTVCTVLNAAVRTYSMASQTLITPISAGQTFCFSVFIQGSSSPTNISTNLKIFWLDGSGNNFIGSPSLFTGPVPTGTGLVRYSLTATAPATAVYAQPLVELNVTNATNSGTITITEPQFEPVWFPTLSYPTPWCAGNQTNCQQLPNGLYIRQYRKFAGFVTFVTAQDYHGNVRTLVVQASGYAWLMGVIVVNDTFANKTDAQIITTLLGKYLLNNGAAMLNTTNVVTGQTLTSVQSNWDDLRTIFDNLAAQSTFYWTIDAYWNFIYAPPGYFAMPISLICDDSSNPNMTTTFPAYAFSADHDYTQPGSNILVLGNGSNVAQVTDPSVIGQIGITSGYILPTSNSWMRKVNESSLASVADCTNRGIAELLQYDYPRNIYHLTTNVELIPGESIQITSATEGLSQSTQLIQQTTATWIGTNETLTDMWEYASDLGATNRNTTNILSRIFRIANSGTSAPAISSTTLAVFENIGVVDSTGTGTTVSNYAQTILADTPVAYYRLAEITGTIADDISGHAQQGTLNGGVTEGTATLLTDPADTSDLAMTFDGTSGFIALPTSGTWPTGNGAWSVECWCKPTNNTNTNNGHLVTIGNPGTNGAVGAIAQTNTGGWGIVTYGGAGHDFQSNGTSTAGTIYYIAGTYDGASHLDLYVGTGGTVTHYGSFNPGTLNLSAVHQAISGFNNGSGQTFFFNGVIDEPAIYNYKLSSAQVNAHYAAGI